MLKLMFQYIGYTIILATYLLIVFVIYMFATGNIEFNFNKKPENKLECEIHIPTGTLLVTDDYIKANGKRYKVIK